MSGVDCTFCVHPAETKCKRGLDCCQKCAVEVSPNMPDAVVSDLVRGRVLSADWHTPMRPEQAARIHQSMRESFTETFAALDSLTIRRTP